MEDKNITVYVDGTPKFKISVNEKTKIGQIKKILSDQVKYSEVRMEVTKGKDLPKVFQTDTYDKTTLKSIFRNLNDAKIFLTQTRKLGKVLLLHCSFFFHSLDKT